MKTTALTINLSIFYYNLHPFPQLEHLLTGPCAAVCWDRVGFFLDPLKLRENFKTICFTIFELAYVLLYSVSQFDV
jgi:hypothetical protein